MGLIFSCKTAKPAETQAPQEVMPESALIFENLEAENPEILCLNFILDLYNTTAHDAEIVSQNPELVINGISSNNSFYAIDIPKSNSLMLQERKSIPFQLVFYASEFEKELQSDFDEYEFALTLPVQYIFPDKTADTVAYTEIFFPRVRKPHFHITQIRIVQAELINTRLRVSIQIDNPNHFPVELSSFNYELYGDGRFWARGKEEDLLIIPARESSGINLFLTMNFTNMRRNVLDQIINMTRVRYRFKGNANVATGVPHLPHFVTNFEHEGHSDVMR